MAANAVPFFWRDLSIYSFRFNNSLLRIASYPNNYNASTCAGINIIHFLEHIKPAFDKLLSDDALDVSGLQKRRRLAMLATRGHKYSLLRHPCFVDIIGS